MQKLEKTGCMRIFIVDDHPVMRRGLGHVIDSLPDMQLAGEAAQAEEALEKIEQAAPDLVLVDISPGGRSGMELIKELRSRHDSIKILVLSMHDESLYAERSIRAGALGYVHKNAPTESLVEGMRKALAGEIVLSPKIANQMLRRAARRDQPISSPVETLSDRELEVFALIGEGLITKQIAAQLNLSTKTIETYRENIKAKLDLKNGSELMRNAVQWVLERG